MTKEEEDIIRNSPLATMRIRIIASRQAATQASPMVKAASRAAGRRSLARCPSTPTWPRSPPAATSTLTTAASCKQLSHNINLKINICLGNCRRSIIRPTSPVCKIVGEAGSIRGLTSPSTRATRSTTRTSRAPPIPCKNIQDTAATSHEVCAPITHIPDTTTAITDIIMMMMSRWLRHTSRKAAAESQLLHR